MLNEKWGYGTLIEVLEFMFLPLLLLFSFFTTATELTAGDGEGYIEQQEEIVGYVPGPRSTRVVRRRCREGECRRPRPPVVEGQKLIYIFPPSEPIGSVLKEQKGPVAKGQSEKTQSEKTQSEKVNIVKEQNYVQLHAPVKSFFRQWAKSCYEKETLDEWFQHFTVRDNDVTSFAGSLEMLEQSKYQSSWQKLLVEYDPKILIFLLQIPEKPYTAEKWEKVLAQVPSYIGCVLMAPPTQQNSNSVHYKNLRAAITKLNSSCQIIRADQEILSLAQGEQAKIFNYKGQLTSDGQAQWWKQTRFQLCDLEPMREVSGSKVRGY